jgi:hypothetical protein
MPHEVSVVSACSVPPLDPERYEVIPIGVTTQGRGVLLPAGPPTLPVGADAGRLPGVADDAGAEVALDQAPGAHALVAHDGARTEIDVVFPVMHGPHGEDGSIQGFLEMAGIPYVGSGVLASAVGMDKAIQKVLFAAGGIPVVAFEVVHEREWEEPRPSRRGRLGYRSRQAGGAGSPSISRKGAAGPGTWRKRPIRPQAARTLGRGARELEVGAGNDGPVACLARSSRAATSSAATTPAPGRARRAITCPCRARRLTRCDVAVARQGSTVGDGSVDFFLARGEPLPQ